ncbi:hypothetical protein ASPVEDRAFT_143152 [Aspergillus versicolor CBS 583.65]|uniref:CS domain-containing protein n=1 Tax=Aspergillus versicolor CBS 583.65 TaxID=1036611 RepID=A0A1L9Q2S4_ASPVE|nr:uncharacterized protein ASPVEDRAFT_143152 [Aspergillus versicolor CBS 583.65]OJJ08064.1 hypothetical protein ASPVEDRAFT_143152 [Aspergillus versicolor CBS 583.65]
MNAASQGDDAAAKSDFLGALQHYTRALAELPRAPTYYIKRSTAYIRLKPSDGGPNAQAALRDAEIAVILGRERAKRDFILAAQMRRAIALWHLERYGDAGFVLELLDEKVGDKGKQGSDGIGNPGAAGRVKDVMSGSKSSGPAKSLPQELSIWLMKIKAKLGQLEESDERRKVSVEEFPVGVKVPSEKDLKKQLEALKAGKIGGGDESSVAPDTAAVADKKETGDASVGASNEVKPPAAATSQAIGSIRHEWYQSNDSIVVTLYAKGVAKESVDAELKSDSVSVQFPLPSGSEYTFSLDPLFASIDESTSKINTFGTKVELVLRKKAPGQKWSSLESSPSTIKPSTVPSTDAAPKLAAGPSYPTSSRHGAKDWDKVASTLTTKKPKKPHSHENGKGKPTEKANGEADELADESDNEGSVDSEYGGDAVDGFFKKLYADADDDTRRAMMKSFVESNGTSLSTNWSEVGKGKVEPYQSKD